MKNKYTLNEIGDAVFKLIDGFEKLKHEVDEIKQKVGHINNRLDYIVKANKLKDLPKKR